MAAIEQIETTCYFITQKPDQYISLKFTLHHKVNCYYSPQWCTHLGVYSEINMKAFRELDRVLRGEPVVNSQVPVHMPSLVVMNLVLAVVYGCCIGSFGLFGRDAPEYRQVLASAVKLPLMFLLTLGVTFPSLYVFNTLLGTQLRFAVLVRVLTCAMAILTTVMVPLAPSWRSFRRPRSTTRSSCC